MTMMRHSACSSRLLRSRKRRLREAAQRGSAAERGQHEERDLLIALAERRLRQPAQRDDPGFAQDREVLDHLVVDLPEAELLIAVGVVVQRDAVEPAAPGIARRRCASRTPTVPCVCT